ncbi:MAG: iron-sulfur cluster repair di-iron protein [Flavobacteriales bacterium]|nr:iron-sulfur cluster repair di-iron protein [Flavobacteriales bacterium]
MNFTENNKVGELVAQDYRTASIFKEYGIDFCCNGNRTIQEACGKVKLDCNVLIEKLNQSLQNSDSSGINFKTWDLDLLVDYIEKKHHRYVERKIKEITPFLNKIVSVHGEAHPELHVVKQLFNESVGELTAHMKKEELILFPYIRKMVMAKNSGQNFNTALFKTVETPIAMMQNEHEVEGERFRKIANLTQNYTPPADACNTYSVTFSLLKEFEEDLHLHIHLENNILFPKAIELEK